MTEIRPTNPADRDRQKLLDAAAAAGRVSFGPNEGGDAGRNVGGDAGQNEGTGGADDNSSENENPSQDEG